MRTKIILISCLIAGLILGGGCQKLVQVPEPTSTITTAETFSNTANATAAVMGIYANLGQGQGEMDWGNGFTTLMTGMYADEYQYLTSNVLMDQFQDNELESNNSYLNSFFWQPIYKDIYSANAVIEGVQGNSALDAATQKQLMGEAQFLRAFCYFYLVNLYGNAPLVTTTAYAQTDLLPAAPPSQIYPFIISDLHSAESLLPGDYSASGGERIRANSWAATALLARVYLYMGNWAGADSASSAVLANPSLFALTDPNSTFLANSQEAIWQVEPSAFSNYATWEATTALPYPLNTGYTLYLLAPTLLNAFDSGDLRRTDWVDSTSYRGEHFSFKYKVKTSTQGNVTEYYMMLRLGEQYLIRAEAEAHGAGGGIPSAVLDMDMIRSRAQLAPYAGATDSASVLGAIAHERQVELFAEWGHRWFDLKRWGTAGAVLSGISYKSAWNPDKLLWPFPYTELQFDPKLNQNPGY